MITILNIRVTAFAMQCALGVLDVAVGTPGGTIAGSSDIFPMGAASSSLAITTRAYGCLFFFCF